MQEQLSRANAYIAQHSAQVNPRFRQSYHLMPPVGWMNDPKGFNSIPMIASGDLCIGVTHVAKI